MPKRSKRNEYEDEHEYEFLTAADKEILKRKGRLVDLIEFLRKDQKLSFEEIGRRVGRTNIQFWFRRKNKTIPNSESLERLAIIAGRHHTGKPWNLMQIREYLETGEYPKLDNESPKGAELIVEKLSTLPPTEIMKIIRAAISQLKSPAHLGEVIGFCSSALVSVPHNSGNQQQEDHFDQSEE